jgi:hypothetical protein
MSQKNYKETVNLPRTDFPMKPIWSRANRCALEQWEAAGLYRRIQEARKEAPLFVLHDGPPFANGDVHMGTALNKILKDLIVKSKTMAGFRAPFIPGWDCHGLPIEFKVVKASAGLSPVEVRRRSEEYARKFIGIQRGQFRRLGCWATGTRRISPWIPHTKPRCCGRSPGSSRGTWCIARRSRSIGVPARRPRWQRRRWNTRAGSIPRFMSHSGL